MPAEHHDENPRLRRQVLSNPPNGKEEGTASTFRGLLEVFERHGLALSLYTDRGSHYSRTDEAGGKVDRGLPTQVGRALAHLGVEHIAAYGGRNSFHTRHDATVAVAHEADLN